MCYHGVRLSQGRPGGDPNIVLRLFARKPPIRFRKPAHQGRSLELRLLLWNLPIALLAGAAHMMSRPATWGSFLAALTPLLAIAGAALAVHLLFRVTRFDGDPVLLPILTTLLLVGATYHMGLRLRAGTPGSIADYLPAALIGLVTVAVTTLGAPLFRRLGHLFEERVWWRFAKDLPYYPSVPFYLALVGLMSVLLLGLLIGGRPEVSSGAIVRVPLMRGVSFTPSEFVRLAVAFLLADFLGRNSRVLRNLREPLGRVFPFNRIMMEPRIELVVLLGSVLLYCLFFYAFRDLGPAVVILVLAMLALYAATLRPTTPLMLAGILLVLVLWPAYTGAAFTTLHRRLEMWQDPWSTTFVGGDHMARILWAMSSGGWLGLAGDPRANVRAQLPEAARDAAFAGVAASEGFWVGLAVLVMFAALAWRGYRIALAGSTDRARLLGFTLTSLLAVQALWICGAMVRLFPLTGINVPFISTGISNMLASAIALGVLLNLSRPSAVPPDATESSPETRTGVRRLAPVVAWSFAVPAVLLTYYAVPWIGGDATLIRTAKAKGRDGQTSEFSNRFVEEFRRGFDRGNIYAADGELMAVSHPSSADMALIRQRTPAFARKIERKTKSDQRFYPFENNAAQLLGWTTEGRFRRQPDSVESTFDSQLRGYHERELPWLYRTRFNPVTRKPQPQDLILTVDGRLQRVAARLLRKAITDYKGSGGAVVLLDPDTGKVLAAATEPAFDPNGMDAERMQKYISQHASTQVLANKALSKTTRYYPGSTFKILTAATALAEGTTGGAICRGANGHEITWDYGGRRYRRAVGKVRDYGGIAHGDWALQGDLGRALAVSCNVFFASLSSQIGVERFAQSMKQADLAGAPEPEKLADYLAETGYGQIGILTAPIEMAMLAAAAGVAAPETDPNVAARYPYWVESVVQGGRRRVAEGQYGAIRQDSYRPFSTDVARQLREMMIGVVETPGATAYAAFHAGGAPRLPLIRVGGKTGTAEFDKTVTVKGKKVTQRGRHAWFIGFARNERPDAAPETVAFAVLIEDVRSRATGGTVGAPLARDLLAAKFGPYTPPAPIPEEPLAPARRWWENLWQDFRERIRL